MHDHRLNLIILIDPHLFLRRLLSRGLLFLLGDSDLERVRRLGEEERLFGERLFGEEERRFLRLFFI